MEFISPDCSQDDVIIEVFDERPDLWWPSSHIGLSDVQLTSSRL